MKYEDDDSTKKVAAEESPPMPNESNLHCKLPPSLPSFLPIRFPKIPEKCFSGLSLSYVVQILVGESTACIDPSYVFQRLFFEVLLHFT